MPNDPMPAVDRQYRAVVIGCGQIGSLLTAKAKMPGVHSHAQAYREQPRTDLVGMCDTDPERALEARRLWNVETDADSLALCRRMRPDIVSICTPDASHFPLAEGLLLECPPRVLFIEKPLTVRMKEAEQILELAARQGAAVAVNFSRRFSPAFQTLRRELMAGQHGRPLLARILYSKGLLHNGTHAIDLMRYWLGEPVRAIGYPGAWGPEGDETYTAELWFDNGCRGRLEAFDDRIATVFELDFLAERSRWRFWAGGNQWEFFEIVDSPLYTGYQSYTPTQRAVNDRVFTNPLGECLTRAVSNIVDYLDGRAALLCDGEDGKAALYWAERIRGTG